MSDTVSARIDLRMSPCERRWFRNAGLSRMLWKREQTREMDGREESGRRERHSTRRSSGRDVKEVAVVEKGRRWALVRWMGRRIREAFGSGTQERTSHEKLRELQVLSGMACEHIRQSVNLDSP